MVTLSGIIDNFLGSKRSAPVSPTPRVHSVFIHRCDCPYREIRIPFFETLRCQNREILDRVPGLAGVVDAFFDASLPVSRSQRTYERPTKPRASWWHESQGFMDPYEHAARIVLGIEERKIAYADLALSHNAITPNYNVLNEAGCPIPQRILPARFFPTGFHRVTSATKLSNGALEFSGESVSDDRLPYVFPFDIDVALYLTFADPMVIYAPAFSLEGIEGKKDSFPLWIKEFSPTWLALTPMGQSFFHADYLMKQITSGNALASVTEPVVMRPYLSEGNSFADFRVPPWMEDFFLKRLTEKHPSLKEHDSSRLCIKARSADLRRDTNGWHLLDIEPHIESSYIIKKKGKEDRSPYTNDLRYNAGRCAARMEAMYESFEGAFPVFGRVRELFGLIALLRQARLDGYVPQGETAQRMNAFGAWIQQQRVKPEYVAKLYHRNGCRCGSGGCSSGDIDIRVNQRSSWEDRDRAHSVAVRERDLVAASDYGRRANVTITGAHDERRTLHGAIFDYVTDRREADAFYNSGCIFADQIKKGDACLPRGEELRVPEPQPLWGGSSFYKQGVHDVAVSAALVAGFAGWIATRTLKRTRDLYYS